MLSGPLSRASMHHPRPQPRVGMRKKITGGENIKAQWIKPSKKNEIVLVSACGRHSK